MAFYLISPSLRSVILQCQEHLRGALLAAHSACICPCILSIEYNILNNKLVQPLKELPLLYYTKNELS